jgi:hypothetical protein
MGNGSGGRAIRGQSPFFALEIRALTPILLHATTMKLVSPAAVVLAEAGIHAERIALRLDAKQTPVPKYCSFDLRVVRDIPILGTIVPNTGT